MKLFPAPARCEPLEDLFDYRNATWIRVSPGLSSTFVARVMAFKRAVGTAFQGSLTVSKGRVEHGSSLVDIALNPNLEGPQAYAMETRPGGVVIEAADEAGAFYALQTLEQILTLEGGCFKGFRIEDEPDFAHRGIMLDISRAKVPTMETLFGLIDLMARLKLNQLQLYFEHTFAFSGHETVWAESSPVTAEEILILDRYCQDRYIELVPNFNSFGHFERWLKHPQYRELAESPDGFVTPWGERRHCGSVLKPRQESLDFLDALYAELLPNFSSRLFNVGCDETWELGQGWSRELCESKGKARVYLDFLLKIHTLARKHGRTMQFWGDIIIGQPERVKDLPKDVIALEWGYEKDHPFLEHGQCFRESGVPFYVCPGTSAWSSLTGRTDNCLHNLINAAESGRRNGANGFLMTDWGDGGHHQYLPLSFTGYFAGAACSWNLEQNRNADFAGAINRFAFRDSSDTLARIMMEMGDVYLNFKFQLANKTAFNSLLFKDQAQLADEGLLESITTGELIACEEDFRSIAQRLALFRPENQASALACEEIMNNLAMAQFAVRKALHAKATEAPGEAEKHAMHTEILRIIGQHEKLWLRRNRPGGLHESSQRLRVHLKRDPA